MTNNPRLFDIWAAHYLYAVYHHTDQWSPLYRLSCRMSQRSYRPSISEQNGLLTTEARDEYNRLIATNYDPNYRD